MTTKCTITRLNQHGFDHVMLAVLCALLVGGVGTFMLVLSHASPWKGYLEVYRQHSRYCLTTNSGTTGSLVVLDPCSKTANAKQTWQLNYLRTITVVGNPKVQEYELQSGAGTNECLDDWQKNKTIGVPQLKLYPCKASDTGVTWVWGVQFVKYGFSSHQIANVASASSNNAGLCLDDYQGSHMPGTRIDLYTCKLSGQANQEWFETAMP